MLSPWTATASWGAVSLMLLAGRRVDAFYYPGIPLHNYERGDDTALNVNAMTSTHTQIPKDFYSFQYCIPGDGPRDERVNFGEYLTGNRIQNSLHYLQMTFPVTTCRILCQQTLTEKGARDFHSHIKNGYHHNWIVDNLPSGHLQTINGEKKRTYTGGFPIGFMSNDGERAYINNHVNIIIRFNRVNEDHYRVVEFMVEPKSVVHKFEGAFVWDGVSPNAYSQKFTTCEEIKDYENFGDHQEVKPGAEVIFTYNVEWLRNDDPPWSRRWEPYFTQDHRGPTNVRWYSISNSIIVVLLLTMMTTTILIRNLRRDISKYRAKTDEEEADDSGWKLLHADVFRPPTSCPMLFCVCVGSGVQLGFAAFFTIVVAAMGYLSPAQRGWLVIAILSFYSVSAVFGGYVSSRLYNSFNGNQPHSCTILTATGFPGITFGFFVVFNILLSFYQSTGAVPLVNLAILALIWLGVCIPLNFLGAYVGYKQSPIRFPTESSTNPRPIPAPKSVRFDPTLGIALTGIVPFASAFAELYSIMTSLWLDRFYCFFNLALTVYIITIATTTLVTLLSVYYQLCGENHHWWWHSFFSAGGISYYMMAYSTLWLRNLNPSAIVLTYLLYFGYMAVICFGMLLIFGSIGSLASLWFVRRMYASVKRE